MILYKPMLPSLTLVKKLLRRKQSSLSISSYPLTIWYENLLGCISMKKSIAVWMIPLNSVFICFINSNEIYSWWIWSNKCVLVRVKKNHDRCHSLECLQELHFHYYWFIVTPFSFKVSLVSRPLETLLQ